MNQRALTRVAFAASVAALAVLSLDLEALARSCRPSLIPNGSKNNCSNCHTSRLGGGPTNAFGSAVRPLVGGLCQPFWGPDIAKKDSDGDGLTNGEELGDPEGTWSVGKPQPGDPARVLNPGVKDAPPPFIRGDANADGVIDVSDAGQVLLILFAGRPAISCQAAEDADGNETIDLSDAVYLLEYLFLGGPPPEPFPGCGRGTGADLTWGCATPSGSRGG